MPLGFRKIQASGEALGASQQGEVMHYQQHAAAIGTVLARTGNT
jgi:hypothetical protein